MKAMILAAGYGKRMRPLTDHTPKPLLQAGGKALIEYHIEKLRDGGIDSLVINTGWLGDRLAATLGRPGETPATLIWDSTRTDNSDDDITIITLQRR